MKTDKCKTCGINDRLPKLRLCKTCRYALKNERRNTAGSRDWYKRKFNSIARRAKIYNRYFSLSFEEFVKLYTQSICAYCEKEMIKKSVDRIDNSQGYTKDNCVVVCFECNVLKNKMSLLQIKNIYTLSKQRGLSQ